MTSEETIAYPIPYFIDEDKPFWDGVQEGKLLIQKCSDCNTLQYFPRPVCVHCFSMNLGWQQASGLGKVYSFTPVLTPAHPAYRKALEETKVPALFAQILLDEGVIMMSEIMGSKPEEVQVGARVKVSFEVAKGTDFKLPKFRLLKK